MQGRLFSVLPFVFNSIFEGTGHVVVVVSPLVNSIKGKVDKLENLGTLVASLSDICEENARVVRAKKCLKIKHARGDRPHFSDGMGFYI